MIPLPGGLVALLAAALMGLAIQRGATCMVAAVAELVDTGKASRAMALLEATLWVGGLVAVARLLGLTGTPPGGFEISWRCLAGGIALGLGAWLNAACMFGTVARIGSGQWAWLATPVGYFVACLAVPDTAPAVPHVASTLVNPLLLALLLFGLLIRQAVQAVRASSLTAYFWHPHRATLLIAVTFVVTMFTANAWAYTDALAALASRMDAQLPLRSVMVLALFGGAIGGGWLAGTLRQVRPTAATAARCLAGGGLMGVGAMLVPGGNDGLIMLGLPFLQPQAWLSVPVMAVAIALAMAISRQLTLARSVAKS